MKLWDSTRCQRELNKRWDRAYMNTRDGRFAKRLSGHAARAIYRETRCLNLPRAPLDGPPAKAVETYRPNAFAQRYAKLGLSGMRVELNALLRGETLSGRAARTRAKSAKTCPHCGGAL